jgi:hypothetical protein
MAEETAEDYNKLMSDLSKDFKVGQALYGHYLDKILNRDPEAARDVKERLIDHINKYPLVFDVTSSFIPINEEPLAVRLRDPHNMHVARFRARSAPPYERPLGSFANHNVPARQVYYAPEARPGKKRRITNYFSGRLTPITRRNGNGNNNNGNNNNANNNNGNNNNGNNNNANNNRRSQGGAKKTRRRK